MSFLGLASWRHLLLHPWQLVLAVLGIALGVTMVVAVDLANQGASRAFERSAEALTGTTTHQVLAGPSGLSEDWYARLRRSGRITTLAPVVEGEARLPADGGRVWRILGVDVLAESGLRPTMAEIGTGADLGGWLSQPGRVALLGSELDAFGLSPGDRLPVEILGQRHALRIHARLEPERALDAEGLRQVLVVDLATAQELLDRIGRIDRLDVVMPDMESVAWLESQLPGDAQLVVAASRNAALLEMSRAFQLNLTAFSLLALMVGAFLIYNTMAFSVVQRRPLFARLRALGVGRGQLFRLVLGEALLLGLLGTVAGLMLGYALSTLLLDLVGRTINDLYFLLSVQSVALTPESLVKGAVLGVGMTMLAAWVPAVEATTASPQSALQRAALEAGVRGWLRTLALIGGGAMLIAVPLILSGEGLVAAFAGLFLIILGWALLVPGLLVGLILLATPLLAGVAGVSGRMAARGISAGLSRTGMATAALAVAMSAVIGVAVMVDSFRHTFAIWLDATLQADVYVTADAGLSPAEVQRLQSADGVAGSSTGRNVDVPIDGQRTRLRVFDLPGDRTAGFRFLGATGEDALDRFMAGDGVFITEPWAWHRTVTTGDTLTLATPRGEQRSPVLGVIQDYSRSAGAVVAHRQLYDRYWDDSRVDSVAIHLEAGVDGRAWIDQQQAVAFAGSALAFRFNREIRRLSLAVFDQTFTITQVLRWLATLVALVGVTSALMALSLERGREHALLRAIGLLPGELWRLVSTQNLLLGACAGLLALPLGLVLAAVLTLVINQRSFGWTMSLRLDPMLPLQAVLWALLAAVVAGLYPAWRAARASPARALREEGAP